MQDPFFIVQNEVNETVGIARMVTSWLPGSLLIDLIKLIVLPLQLQSVQARFSQLRALPVSHSNRKALQSELEEDCNSIEYMVSRQFYVEAYCPWSRNLINRVLRSSMRLRGHWTRLKVTLVASN